MERLAALWNRDANGKGAIVAGGMFVLVTLAALVGSMVGGSPAPAHAPEVIATQRSAREEATSTPRPTRPPRATDTAEPPTATDVPATNTPLPPPVQPTPADLTELPTEAPPAPQGLMSAPQQPADPGPPHPEWTADGDRNCKDFASHRDAQAWWDYWHARGVPNPGGLDGNDNDGDVCESR